MKAEERRKRERERVQIHNKGHEVIERASLGNQQHVSFGTHSPLVPHPLVWTRDLSQRLIIHVHKDIY